MKFRLIILLTSASILAWATTGEARMRVRHGVAAKPSVEVHLQALEQLRYQSAGVPNSQTAIPFNVKPRTTYQDAPSIRRAPTPPKATAQTIAPTAPALAPTSSVARPVSPPPPAAAPVAVTRQTPTPIQSNTPPSAFAGKPTRSATSLSRLGLPPLVPPGQTAPKTSAPTPKPTTVTTQEDSSWWEDTTDAVTGVFDTDIFGFSEDEPETVPPVSKAAVAPPPSTTPAPVVIKRQAKAVPSTPPATKELPPPNITPTPAENAARYDGLEMVKGLSTPSALPKTQPVQSAKRTADPSLTELMQQPAPLPKPASPETEMLLGQVTGDGTQMVAPAPTPTAKPAVSSQPTTNINTNSKLAEPKSTLPPPTEPAVSTPVSEDDEQPWYDGLKKELDEYFEDEQKTQEESKQEAPKVAMVAKKEEPFLAPPPVSPTPTQPLSAPTEPTKEKTTPQVIRSKMTTKRLPTLPSEPSAQQAKATPKTELPALSKLTGDTKVMEDTAKSKVEVERKLPSLPVDAPAKSAPKKSTKQVVAKKQPEAKVKITKQQPAATKPKLAPKKEVNQQAAKAEIPNEAKKVEKKVEQKTEKKIEPEIKKKKPEAVTAPEVKISAAIPTVTPEPSKPASTVNGEKGQEVTLTREPPEEKVTQMASLPKTSSKTAAPAETLKLTFNASDTDLTASGKQQLADVASKLNASQTRRLTIRAYASAEAGQEVLARRIALARGLAVRAYLIDQGVSALRINVQSVGNSSGAKTPDEVVLELKDIGGA